MELTREVALELGRRLAACGVNFNWAPSADVNSNPGNPVIGVRSFGAAPDLVARHTAAYVTGLQSAGVAACTKHFPGHGDTAIDSHHALPRIDADGSVLHDRELTPFRAAIAGRHPGGDDRSHPGPGPGPGTSRHLVPAGPHRPAARRTRLRRPDRHRRHGDAGHRRHLRHRTRQCSRPRERRRRHLRGRRPGRRRDGTPPARRPRHRSPLRRTPRGAPGGRGGSRPDPGPLGGVDEGPGERDGGLPGRVVLPGLLDLPGRVGSSLFSCLARLSDLPYLFCFSGPGVPRRRRRRSPRRPPCPAPHRG